MTQTRTYRKVSARFTGNHLYTFTLEDDKVTKATIQSVAYDPHTRTETVSAPIDYASPQSIYDHLKSLVAYGTPHIKYHEPEQEPDSTQEDKEYNLTGTYTFYSDPGHAWLAVPRTEIDQLGIAEIITPYSYQDKTNVYLEEDCDAGKFIDTFKEKLGYEPTINSTYQEKTFIRRLAAYRPTGKGEDWIKAYAEKQNKELGIGQDNE